MITAVTQHIPDLQWVISFQSRKTEDRAHGSRYGVRCLAYRTVILLLQKALAVTHILSSTIPDLWRTLLINTMSTVLMLSKRVSLQRLSKIQDTGTIPITVSDVRQIQTGRN